MDRIHEILKQYWGYDEFRPLQEEIIRSVADQKDTLGLMPTGGGKSITFQVYSLSVDGICLVVTPLIALIKDQVENLRSKGIKVLAIYSGMSGREIDIALNNAIYGDYKFLYVSPERLGSEHFREFLVRMKLNLITVDEAHCISQWGYDFRPSYLKISELRELFPQTPILALTATATKKVVDDIQEKLLFREKNVLQKSFRRANLIYLVRDKEDKMGYLTDTIRKSKGTGIVYVRSRKKTREIAQMLQQHKIAADFYHAGLAPDLRSHKQDKWMRGEIRVIVATNAFGMGIDKPDVRFVIHLDLPDSLEAYFQEAGRGGRDGLKSVAVLLYNNTDKRRLHKMVTDSFPAIEIIRSVYNSVCNFLMIAIGSGKSGIFSFRIEDFSKRFGFQITAVYHSLKILERQGYVSYIENVDNYSRVMFTVRRDDLYKIQLRNAELDSFIKLILRSYTGVFTDFVNIDEALLARRSNLTGELIYLHLKTLAQNKIIDYIPQKKTPVLVFETERLDTNRIHISADNYQHRKVKYQLQVDSVIDYAVNDNKCRSVALLEYFGQYGSEPCGSCDICRGDHESGIKFTDFSRISGKIHEILCTESHSIDQIVKQISEPEPVVIKVSRWLLDNGMLIAASNGLLTNVSKAH
ncbi:MAG: RecQ family ATP-dependent DNA helicase [Mariniphaga sp.]|nr:RecQ family ATP-dependent DNA helicase [Mariniphaga sp.]